jgi:hypothetical protein
MIIVRHHVFLSLAPPWTHHLSALVVSYAYYPDAQTLYDVHFKSINGAPPPPPPSGSGGVIPSTGRRARGPSDPANETEQQNSIIPERTLWSYIVQIASAIKKVHETGNPVRMIDATKILVTGQNRYVNSPLEQTPHVKRRKKNTAYGYHPAV